ncbi:MAG: 3'(2'),5'-bisphosphate nucleotidase CysQ, partial [Rhizobiales bacterium]|nr:3'(2'),5'-bisphosphate nucleotidase CysQ [Hyphomicrobiales bacterium]
MPEQPLIPDSVDAPLMHALSVLVAEACTVVTAARAAPLAVRTKHDASPVTAADEASEAILLAGLARLMPGVPVISEEQARRTRQDADIFAIVDPLDGTREFVAGRNEFTVNVAIVHRGVSVAGLIAAPARGTLWRGVRGRGAERLTFRDEQLGPAEPVRARAWRAETACAVASRSRLDAGGAAVLARVTTRAQLLCG